MPRKYGYKRKPAARKPRRARKGRVARKPRNATPNYAIITDGFELNIGGTSPTSLRLDTMYTSTVTLDQFIRAANQSTEFQQYRIKKVDVMMKPAYINFQSPTDTVQTSQCPEIYYITDKSNVINSSYTAQNMRDMGCTPKMFTRLQSHSYAPAVQVVAGAASIFKPTPWISTNEIKVPHYGAWWNVSGNETTDTNYFYTCDIRVTVEFRLPKVNV